MNMLFSRRCHPRNNKDESGNAFFIVLLGVVLFAALMFTFSRSARQGGENIDDKRAEILATDIIAYAQKIERRVNNLRRRSVSENDISFENDFVLTYTNPNCSVDRCKIFKGSGSINWQSPPEGANDGSDWVFTGSNYIDGLGSAGNAADAELLVMLPNVLRSVCAQINEYLDINGIPQNTGNTNDTVFTGSFTASPALIKEDVGTALEGQSSGCFEGAGTPPAGTYHFYHVLIQRP